jgi:hypothetical protein
MDSLRRIGPLLEEPSGERESKGTLFAPLGALVRRLTLQEVSFRDLFLRHFRWIRWAIAGNSEPGYLLLTADAGGLADGLWLRSEQHSINAAVVGRHAECPLRLGEDREASLRHAAVILGRQRPGAPLRLRLVDLRSASGLVDEQGCRWHGLESDGPVAVRMGPSVFMAFPTGGAAPAWSDDAEQAWQSIPPRAYIEAEEAAPVPAPVAWRRERGEAPGAGGTTLVRTWPAPLTWSRSLLDADEVPRGELHIRSGQGQACLRVGSRALGRGVLLGRYSRCDNDGVPVLSDRCFSRVHALVIDVDGQVHAVDAGSTNGLWCALERVRRCPLSQNEDVELGGGPARLSWVALH